MKTNKMMRIASVLLVAVLLTTCVISGTFAKYTASADATAAADIAKWSFNVDGKNIVSEDFTFDLFKTVKDYNGEAENEVTANMIAPGTSGDVSLVLTNTSDVAVSYTVTLAAGAENNVTPPIEYSVDNGTTWKAIAQAETATGEITMGGNATVKVMWRWAFEGDDNATGIAAANGSAVYEIVATVAVEQIETLGA